MTENRELFEAADYESIELQSRKNAAIIFVYDIIVDNTSRRNPFSTADIIRRLDRYPYSIEIERRAVSNMITALALEYPYIVKNEDGRVWYDPGRTSLAA